MRFYLHLWKSSIFCCWCRWDHRNLRKGMKMKFLFSFLNGVYCLPSISCHNCISQSTTSFPISFALLWSSWDESKGFNLVIFLFDGRVHLGRGRNDYDRPHNSCQLNYFLMHKLLFQSVHQMSFQLYGNTVLVERTGSQWKQSLFSIHFLLPCLPSYCLTNQRPALKLRLHSVAQAGFWAITELVRLSCWMA